MRPDKGKPYYTAYDKRYRSVYEQGADRYAFLPLEEEIKELIGVYIAQCELAGKKVVEFGCGEGWAGVEFAKLGCIYYGYDISPAAIEKATVLLSKYSHAEAVLHDVVLGDLPNEAFDAGIDIGCLHTLVVDADRNKYLKNVHKCLKPGAPMYFAYLVYGDDVYNGEVTSYEQWLQVAGEDVDTPQERVALKDGKELPVMIPCIAARPRSERVYREELTQSGFEIIRSETVQRWGSARILSRKA